MVAQMRATAEDVAALAGVSAKTVSRVFNQRELVHPETAERVMSAAKRLRFRPNTLARGLRRGGGTNTVGLIVGELGNPFYYKVASGLEQELAPHGFGLLVATTDDTVEGEQRVADILLSQRISALAIIPVSDDQSYLEGERQLGTPIVAIDRPATNLVADSVVLSNDAGSYGATKRLLQHGHRRISYVCNPASIYSQTERVAGYRRAMREAGTDPTPWERLEDDRSLPPERAIADLLTLATPPTALICGNNRMTIGALRAMRALGDTSTALIGFDDFDTADVLNVSVITYDPHELGRQAARVAIERMHDLTGVARQLILPTHVIERGTGERLPQDHNHQQTESR
ncbi:LacI family DNA-binding transcriptional regulator [Microbacterium marmarense]|uniref:LacI family DNA-binding transcriptional regulator n=1 Tax=Microbacterium marmarense TaxID=3122051 RepID=A0ABU8LSY9_9MICO